jgi:hypothetical protein
MSHVELFLFAVIFLVSTVAMLLAIFPNLREEPTISRIPLFLIAIVLVFTSGCANHMTLTRQLQTQASNTIFLQPTKEKIVYIEARNASDNPHALLSELPNRLTQKGYTIVNDPDQAHFLVQATTIFAAKAKPGTTLESLVAGGFGSMIGGGIGSAIAISRGTGFGMIPGGAAVGALAGFIGSKVTEDSQLSLVLDVQITERTKEQVEQVVSSQVAQGGGLPSQNKTIALFSGQSINAPHAGQMTETIQEVHRGHTRMHRARYAAMAQEMWMSEVEASKDLVNRLTDSISGLF